MSSSEAFEKVKSTSLMDNSISQYDSLQSDLSGIVGRDANFTLGVLLTLAESLGLGEVQLKSYKTLIRREMYNLIDQLRGSQETAILYFNDGNLQSNTLPTPMYRRTEHQLPEEENAE